MFFFFDHSQKRKWNQKFTFTLLTTARLLAFGQHTALAVEEIANHAAT